MRLLKIRWRWPWYVPKPGPPPWWQGYVFFPPTDRLSIVLSKGHIVVLDNHDQSITAYVNHGWFLNRQQFRVILHDPPEW